MIKKDNMTAVEWLISQLNKQGFAQVVTDEEIEQALKMEKEQKQEAYDQGNSDAWEVVYQMSHPE